MDILLVRFVDGGGQTGSFPLSEVSSHYEPSESCETNIRKRPVRPRVPVRISVCSEQREMGDEGRGGGQDQSTGPLVKRHIGPSTNFSGKATFQELAAGFRIGDA